MPAAYGEGGGAGGARSELACVISDSTKSPSVGLSAQNQVGRKFGVTAPPGGCSSLKNYSESHERVLLQSNVNRSTC